MRLFFSTLRPRTAERRQIISLVASVLNNHQIKHLFAVSDHTIADARRHNNGLVPGVVPTERSVRTVDRQSRTGRPMSEELAKARRFYERDDNTEQNIWTADDGTSHITLVLKKTVQQIWEAYVAETAAGNAKNAPISPSSFYGCAPANIRRRTLDFCVCATCKDIQHLHKTMRHVITDMKQRYKTDDDKYWNDIRSKHKDLQDHMAQLHWLTLNGKHRPVGRFRTLEEPAASEFRNLKLDEIKAKLKEYGRSPGGKKDAALQRLRLAKQSQSRGDCTSCNLVFDLHECVTTCSESLDANVHITVNNERRNKTQLKDWFRQWKNNIIEGLEHKYETGYQRQSFDHALEYLPDNKEHIFVFDYAASIELKQTATATHDEARSAKEKCTVFGITRYMRKEDDEGNQNTVEIFICSCPKTTHRHRLHYRHLKF